MEEYFDILSQCSLFFGISRQEMGLMLNCLGGKITGIGKGCPVFLEGNPAEFVGVVLSGTVQIVRDDYCGNRSVLTVVSPVDCSGKPSPARAWKRCQSVPLPCKTARFCF